MLLIVITPPPPGRRMEIYYRRFGGKEAPLGGYFVTILSYDTLLLIKLLMFPTEFALATFTLFSKVTADEFLTKFLYS